MLLTNVEAESKKHLRHGATSKVEERKVLVITASKGEKVEWLIPAVTEEQDIERIVGLMSDHVQKR